MLVGVRPAIGAPPDQFIDKRRMKVDPDRGAAKPRVAVMRELVRVAGRIHERIEAARSEPMTMRQVREGVGAGEMRNRQVNRGAVTADAMNLFKGPHHVLQ